MRTAAATEARMRVVDKRMAERLQSRGWTVTPPLDDPTVTVWDGEGPAPCAGGRCPDPEAYAEGGHDV